MDSSNKEYISKEPKHCLQCAEPLSSAYERPDKKFCCRSCRNEYSYRSQNEERAARRRTIAKIERNYELLKSLISCGRQTLNLTQAKLMGLNLGYMTTCTSLRGKLLCSCYDITYELRSDRICKLSKGIK